MPKNVGSYEQGGILTHPADAPHESGMPNRAAPAGPVPQSPQWEPDGMHSAPNNDAHKV